MQASSGEPEQKGIAWAKRAGAETVIPRTGASVSPTDDGEKHFDRPMVSTDPDVASTKRK
jgi:hypothetical protein